MSVGVVIVNYKTKELAGRAMLSALKELPSDPGSGQNSKIYVVDNNSEDGSYEYLKELAQNRHKIEVIQSHKNGGFGAGNNIALRKILAQPPQKRPQYVYLLNPDATPQKNAIIILEQYLDEHPNAGFAGSFIFGDDGVPHTTAFRFPTVQSELEGNIGIGMITRLLRNFVVPLPFYEKPTAVDWMAGASLMMRTSMLDEIGIFDEDYFLYFEEVDLCLRGYRRGYEAHYVPQSRVEHIGSASTGMKSTTKRTPKFWFDSRRHYFLKNHGVSYLRAADLAFALGTTVRKLRPFRKKQAYLDRPKILRDFLEYTVRAKGHNQ